MKPPVKGIGEDDSSEKEKYLSSLQREVQDRYSTGDYSGALELSTQAQSELAEHFGKNHPVVASAHNNSAIALKRLGRFDDAVNQYIRACEIYRSASAGERHPQYLATLTNLGLCFQAAALSKNRKGLERQVRLV